MKKLVVGLGNPGKKYADTRHNIGFKVVERVAEELGFNLRKEADFHGLYAKGEFKGVQTHLLLPETYMNDSGVAVQAVARFYKLIPADIVVVMDDVYLPFGLLRVKAKGSDGGHNGLKSIESHLNSSYYARLKCGIGDERDGSLADHVLSRFKPEEEKKLPQFIDDAAKVVKTLIYDDIQSVMNAVNRSKE